MQSSPSTLAFFTANRNTLLNAGFVAVTYASRNGVYLVKSVASEHFDGKREEDHALDENAMEIYEDDFHLTHPGKTVSEPREPDFVVVEVSADGMVKRTVGIGGRVDGPLPMDKEGALHMLRSVGAIVCPTKFDPLLSGIWGSPC